MLMILCHAPILQINAGVVLVCSIQQKPYIIVVELVAQAFLQQLIALGMACQTILLVLSSGCLFVRWIRTEQLFARHSNPLDSRTDQAQLAHCFLGLQCIYQATQIHERLTLLRRHQTDQGGAIKQG